MQQNILGIDFRNQAFTIDKIGVRRRWLRLETVIWVGKIWEANEVFEVVVAPSRYGIDTFFEVQLL